MTSDIYLKYYKYEQDMQVSPYVFSFETFARNQPFIYNLYQTGKH